MAMKHPHISSRPRGEDVIAYVISSIRPELDLLRDYDMRQLSPKPKTSQLQALAVEDVRLLAAGLRDVYPADSLLGVERGDGLIRILETVNQSFAGVELYPTVEEKAAHLLYFIVKDHPFSDGNKRIATATFALYLTVNANTFDNGGPDISNNGLAALTLLVAVSDPGEKDVMTDLIERMLTGIQPAS